MTGGYTLSAHSCVVKADEYIDPETMGQEEETN